MKIIIPNPPKGPNGEEYEQEAELRDVDKYDHYIGPIGRVEIAVKVHGVRVVLTPKKPKIKWLECKWVKSKDTGFYRKIDSYKEYKYTVESSISYSYDEMCEYFTPIYENPEE
jgi:hypothetical protein